ncbi:MAG: hypothetical protein IPI35_33215 [Deltaproteobacteria bacterium]|nr:hypothetical protein [Deltaproteobacteria bacterium]
MNTGASLEPVLAQLRGQVERVFVLALVSPVETAERLARSWPDVELSSRPNLHKPVCWGWANRHREPPLWDHTSAGVLNVWNRARLYLHKLRLQPQV